MRDFAGQIRASGVAVDLVVVPGVHGEALRQPAALQAVRNFVERRARS
jgi:hypothetical protein